MKYTGHFNLKKPDYTDPIDIKDLNDNADHVDVIASALTGALGITPIVMIPGGYLNTVTDYSDDPNNQYGGEFDPNHVAGDPATTTFKHALVPITPGTVVTLNCVGGSYGRAYSVTDASYNRIAGWTARSNLTCTNLVLTMPEGAAWLVINDNSFGTSYIGQSMADQLSVLKGTVDSDRAAATAALATKASTEQLERTNASIADLAGVTPITMTGKGYYNTGDHTNEANNIHGGEFNPDRGPSGDPATTAFLYAVITVEPGEDYTLSAEGSTYGAPYAIVDTNYNYIEKASTKAVRNKVLTMPDTAMLLIINDKNGSVSYKGRPIAMAVEVLNEMVASQGADLASKADAEETNERLDQADAEIEIIKAKIAGTGIEVPDYWKSELDTSIASAQANELLMSAHSVKYIVVADPHWGLDGENNPSAHNSPDLIAYVAQQLGIDLVICLGDVNRSHWSEKSKAVREMREYFGAFAKHGIKLMVSVGNHDFNANNNSNNPQAFLSDDEVYSLMIQQSESFVQTGGTINYGYFDNPSQKVRFISFKNYAGGRPDGSANGLIQTWINHRMCELPEGWSIILLTHSYWANTTIEGVNQPSVSTAAKNFASELAAVPKAATIVCMHVGHTHCDISTPADPTEEAYTGLLTVATTTDNYNQSLAGFGPSMEKNTSTEHAFDIVQIDLDEQAIYMTRVGAGEDRSFGYTKPDAGVTGSPPIFDDTAGGDLNRLVDAVIEALPASEEVGF